MFDSEETRQFILAHRQEDVRTLALQAGRYPQVDMTDALTQIAGWQMACEKLPAWAAIEGIRYPRHLSMEQCSSQMTARYKADIVRRTLQKADGTENKKKAQSLVDLTGGFGIDCAFMTECFTQATYVERQEELCRLAEHNFSLLGLHHIDIRHTDAVEHLQAMKPVQWIFIDPARRNEHGGKTVAIADCEPDVCLLEEQLLNKADHIMVKLSPMLDLTSSLHQLRHVQEAHIVAVNNECKELLLILGHTETVPDNIPIHCINLTATSRQEFTFTRQQEQNSSVCCHADKTEALQSIAPGRFLYEPNAAILKGGAFRHLSYIYKVEKLHPNSHLYTSEQFIETFPGRSFRITAHCGFSKQEIKAMLGTERKANLTVRNFPTGVTQLRKQLKLAEGGENYLFATTLGSEEKVLIRCQKT